MGQLQAFEVKGKSFTISVGVASQVTAVNLSDLGMTTLPQSLQFENTGTADVWVALSSAANPPAAAFPTPGTTTTGTPQSGTRVRPGEIVVYSCNVSAPNVPSVANPAVSSAGFYIATIGAAAGSLDVTPGEGM